MGFCPTPYLLYTTKSKRQAKIMSDAPTTYAGIALLMAPSTDSGYKGVAKNGKAWQARSGPQNARRHLGSFASKVEAAVAVALDEEIGMSFLRFWFRRDTTDFSSHCPRIPVLSPNFGFRRLQP